MKESIQKRSKAMIEVTLQHSTTKRSNFNTMILQANDEFSLKNERRKVKVMQRLSKASQQRVSLNQDGQQQTEDIAGKKALEMLDEYEQKR